MYQEYCRDTPARQQLSQDDACAPLPAALRRCCSVLVPPLTRNVTYYILQTRQIMSTNAYNTDGSVGGATSVTVPRLVAGRYAEWRPAMENVLMRAGVAQRDYTEENSDWPALVTAVEQWTRADEDASIAYALGRGSASSSSKAGPTAAEKEARRGATEAVARTKKAYALLYQALSDELRRLVAQVPQGYAYGIWSWLEKRFQSTEQDHIGDLWDEFTKLAQEEDESFDVYKSRVDRVYGLLAHAKDKPSPGLYAHRLLWKLCPRYNPAVLALKASGKLKDASTIDWNEIVAFVNNHERSEHRLALNDSEIEQRTFAATRGVRWNDGGDRTKNTQRSDTLTGIECFNCGEGGHMARNCRKPRKASRAENNAKDERDTDSNERTRRQGTKESVSAATTACNRFSSDEDVEDTGSGGTCCTATMQYLPDDQIEDAGGGVRSPRTKATARRGRPFQRGQ